MENILREALQNTKTVARLLVATIGICCIMGFIVPSALADTAATVIGVGEEQSAKVEDLGAHAPEVKIKETTDSAVNAGQLKQSAERTTLVTVDLQKAAQEGAQKIEDQRKADEAAAQAREQAAAQAAAAAASEAAASGPVATSDTSNMVDRLNDYLAGSELDGYGQTFYDAACEYGVDPRLVAAISTVESGKGAHCFRAHNAWGWGGRNFSSWEEGIYAVTAGLHSGYGAGSLSYNMAQRYCPPNYDYWYKHVASEMSKI